jgi:hypothetical protein
MEELDITGKIGPLFGVVTPNPEWPMYSYERPAYMLWNAIANALHAKGWTEPQIKEWLQSKATRWALDSDLGDMIIAAGEQYAQQIAKVESK